MLVIKFPVLKANVNNMYHVPVAQMLFLRHILSPIVVLPIRTVCLKSVFNLF